MRLDPVFCKLSKTKRWPSEEGPAARHAVLPHCQLGVWPELCLWIWLKAGPIRRKFILESGSLHRFRIFALFCATHRYNNSLGLHFQLRRPIKSISPAKHENITLANNPKFAMCHSRTQLTLAAIRGTCGIATGSR